MFLNTHILFKRNQWHPFLYVLFFFASVNSLNLRAACNTLSPTLRCTDVLINGDVVLTWTLPPVIEPDFDRYLVYTSAALNGPYNLLASVAVAAQTTYTHVGANANTAPVYYYVVSTCLTNEQAPALDTLATMNLIATNPLNGTALLSWNSIKTPLLPSAATTYTIYQEYPANNWTITGSKTNNNAPSHNFIDTILVCNGAINYRIHIADNTGCTSLSTLSGGNYQNSILPPVPILDTISVDDDNITHLTWQQNPHPDVDGYIVYRFNGVSFVRVDSVFGISNTSYTYTLSTAFQATEQFRIVAYDSCGNPSVLSAVHGTMFLEAIADVCASSVMLTWSSYASLIGTGLAGYHIYASTLAQSGPYTLIGKVGAGTLNYTVANLNPESMYYFKVVAFDNSGTKTASSNRLPFYSATPPPPAFFYLRKASVLSKSAIELVGHVDFTVPVASYKVYKAIDEAVAMLSFNHIGRISPATTSNVIVYTDTDVNTSENSYVYKLIVEDTCGQESVESNIAQTILLHAKGEEFAFRNHLVWSRYKDWPNNVAYYNIYRGVNGIMGSIPIGSVYPTSATENTYTDNVSAVLADKGIFQYYVEAVEDAGNVYGFTERSNSNIADARQESLIYIPNAFVPEGFNNRVFKPVVTYVDNDSYDFSVFDRMGRMLFHTTDPEEGWDGTYLGALCSVGVYVYAVKLKDARKHDRVLRGTITLLK